MKRKVETSYVGRLTQDLKPVVYVRDHHTDTGQYSHSLLTNHYPSLSEVFSWGNTSPAALTLAGSILANMYPNIAANFTPKLISRFTEQMIAPLSPIEEWTISREEIKQWWEEFFNSLDAIGSGA